MPSAPALLRAVVVVGGCLLAAGPSSAATPGVVLARGVMLPPEVAVEPPIDVLAVTPEMREWARRRVSTALPAPDRLALLVRELQLDDELAMTYDAWATAGATEAFAARRFNCLSFSHLIVALSRQLGLDTYYLQVTGFGSYEREGDLVVFAEHVTVGLGVGSDRVAVELRGAPSTDLWRGQRISDRRALGLHYANLGAAALRRGELDAAMALLATGVRADGDVAATWVNLGVALRRRGDPAGAEAAYRRAIAAEPRALAGYNNLYALLRATGRADAARELMAAVSGRENRNPWLLLALGDACLEDGDREGAERFYRRAHAAAPELAAPAAALAVWAATGGEERQARRWRERAAELDPAEPRLRRLEVIAPPEAPAPAAPRAPAGRAP